MDNMNQSAKTDKKGGDKAIRKASKLSKAPAKVEPPPQIEEVPVLIEEPIEELYNNDVLNNYMLQTSLPEEETIILNFDEDEQVVIFGMSILEKLKNKASIAQEATDGAVSVSPYCGLSVETSELLGALENELADAGLDIVKEKVSAYPGPSMTFIADHSKKFGGNFILIISQELDNELRIEELEIAPRTPEVADAMEEANDSVAFVESQIDKPWMSQGSDREIIQASFFETRPRIVTNFERPRREFCAPITLSDLSSHKLYTEVKPYEDKLFEVPILELERGVCCTNLQSEHYTNTDWRFPRNQVVQYEARSLSLEELEVYVGAKSPLKGIGKLLPLFEQGLKQNLMYDFLFDDYIHLAFGDDTFDNKSGNVFKEIFSFTDLKSSKDKAVTHVAWHPTIEGMVAVSVGEKLTYDERLDQLSRVLVTPAYIVIWSFFESIQPQLLLEAPEDILCFEFCPTDPFIVAGGCFNGMVILWDISKFESELTNVVEKVKNKTKLPLFQFDENEALKVTVAPWCATSNIDASHATPIRQISWMPSHLELNRAGFAIENIHRKCLQLLTCASDGGIFMWDLRPEKSPLAVDKTRDQLTLPKDVPVTFTSLDSKWKPFLRVSVFRPENAPEHCPTRFCLRERQGDLSILESRANIKKKLAAENDPMKVGGAKLLPLEGLNTHLYVGTEEGDLVYVDWMPQKDTQTAKVQTTMPIFTAPQHDGPICYLARSSFMPEILLCVGGCSWSLWKEGVNSNPILSSCISTKALTGGLWSPSRPSVFYIIRADGILESWDLLDKTHEPALLQSVSASALTSVAIKIEGKKQLLAVGDMHGALRVLVVPHRLKVSGPNELKAMSAYIDREVQRRDFVINRWNKREQERIEKENENKRMAGIATVGQLSEEEQLQKMKIEYDLYLASEREFMRALGLWEDDPLEDTAPPAGEATA